MKTETFIFSFNGVRFDNPITMADAIEMARKRAIAGCTVRLSIGNVLLGTYFHNPEPLYYTEPRTRTKRLVERCSVNLVPLANEY